MKYDRITIKDFIAALPGIFLVIGYTLGIVIEHYEVSNPITIESIHAVYEKKPIGVIPKKHAISNKIIIYETIYEQVPILDVNGKPKVNIISKTIKGKGKPQISIELKEILIPKIGVPPWVQKVVSEPIDTVWGDISGPGNKPQIYYRQYFEYTPNIAYVATGVYEIIKEVTYERQIIREKFGILGAGIGAILNLVYLVIKLIMNRIMNDT